MLSFIHVDAGFVAEQLHQNRQADGRFSSRHGQDEENKDLAVQVTQVVRERHEVHVDREQHQFNRHQQDDQVFAVQEDADHREREQNRTQCEVVA